MAIHPFRPLRTSASVTDPIPQYIALNYLNLFKIQHVQNPFPLRPVSYSKLMSYLECPGCALMPPRKKRQKEPVHFSDVHQGTLFGASKPDPRLVGTLLHTIITYLHDPKSPLSKVQQYDLLASPTALKRFLLHDLLTALQADGKLKMAMFFNQLRTNEHFFYPGVLAPLLKYQRELAASSSMVVSVAERFQYKMLSTAHTFSDYSDRGGVVGIVGEFDQIRLRHVGSVHAPDGIPAIVEFKSGLGRKSIWDTCGEPGGLEAADSTQLEQPGVMHAFQLMVYWLAFQTRWDVHEYIQFVKGRCEEIPMPLQQQLDLILYNLFDGAQYQLLLQDQSEALRTLISCIFYLDWAMKSGFMQQMPDHRCSRTPLLADLSPRPIPVGAQAISAEECFLLARDAFARFRMLISWRKV